MVATRTTARPLYHATASPDGVDGRAGKPAGGVHARNRRVYGR